MITTAAALKMLNDRFTNHDSIRAEDVQLFRSIDQFNYYPMKCYVDKDNQFHIEDFIELPEVLVGSRYQFLYKQFTVSQDGISLDINAPEFKTAWDPTKYIMYLNGYKVNRCLYEIIIPSTSNTYPYKILFTNIPLKVNDRVDLFYIEGRDNEFQEVIFNQDIYVAYVRVDYDDRLTDVIQIPYPNSAYPHHPLMFYVFSGKTGRYLDPRYDYTVDVRTASYITLKEMERDMVDSYIVFTFPYANERFETEEVGNFVGERSGVSFFISTSYQEDESMFRTPSPIVNFSPPYTRYTVGKENMLLFRNTTFVQPEWYEIVNNSTIKLLDPNMINAAQFDQYTMFIFDETDSSLTRRQFELQIMQTYTYSTVTNPNTGHQAIIIEIPTTIPADASFLVFQGTVLYDIQEQYSIYQRSGISYIIVDKDRWEDTTNNFIDNAMTIVTETSSYTINSATNLRDFLPLYTKTDNKRPLTFVFYNRKKYNYTKTIEFVKLEFESMEEGKVKIINNTPYILNYNTANFMLFDNGVYLNPERYQINDDVITFTTTPVDVLPIHNAFTGIFLVARNLSHTFDDWMYQDSMDGDPWKLSQFDVRYSTPVETT